MQDAGCKTQDARRRMQDAGRHRGRRYASRKQGNALANSTADYDQIDAQESLAAEVCVCGISPPLIAPFDRLLRSISPPTVAVFWQCLCFV